MTEHDDIPLDDRKLVLLEQLDMARERIEQDWERIQSVRFVVTALTDENKLEVDTASAGRPYADVVGLIAALIDELDDDEVAVTLPLAMLLQSSLEALEQIGLNTRE